MDYLKKAIGILLGALLFGLAVLVWGLVTSAIVSYAERALCWNSNGDEACHLRGVWTFLLWSVVGIVNLLTFGFFIERFGNYAGRRH